MMMFKNSRVSAWMLLFISVLLVVGCNGKREQFIVSSDEDGVICSAKSTFNDTIFYENRFPDTTIYYYAALSKQQNDRLKKSIEKLKFEKSLPQFEIHPGGGTFIVESDDVKFYEANYSLPSSNIKTILRLFREKGSEMKTCKKIEDFWNIDGITPPDNPTP
ncbi:hypothetical protein [Flavobacterium wongokense]|uniref:hypothetical protein n=1 Tax=Flavobacterium wongokense TaxID=2910674 RepID=UPI001F16B78C|nr:hypothetical protein [Flavobacterium sp. WG47]MCF6131488.1 hypothetical protein [Flavobacterium sp. WG47]